MRTAFLGSKAIGLEALRVLRECTECVCALTVDDRNDSRTKLPEFLQAGAQIGSVRDLPVVDFILVAGWYQHIDVSGRRAIGIHHSLLPAYRGGSPLVWAMIAGELVVGTSIFELTDALDAGPLWAQRQTMVGPDEYIGDVLERVDGLAIEALPHVLQAIGRGESPEPQRGSGKIVPTRHPADGRIDWTRPAAEIVRFVRAQSRPYPGAFSILPGRPPETIWRASVAEPRPGERMNNVIAAGSGFVRVEEAAPQRLAA